MEYLDLVRFVKLLLYPGLEPPPDWPKNGGISVENIRVRYASNLDAVLRDVSIEFPAGQKVREIVQNRVQKISCP